MIRGFDQFQSYFHLNDVSSIHLPEDLRCHERSGVKAAVRQVYPCIKQDEFLACFLPGSTQWDHVTGSCFYRMDQSSPMKQVNALVKNVCADSLKR